MYGLIHRSIMDMVVTGHGEEAWRRVKSASGVGDEAFLTMHSYDDSVTFALVKAACDEVGIGIDTCLEAFGEHWVKETATKAYASLMASYGRTLWEFLENLDFMHDRISTSFPGFSAPSFELERTAEGSHLLHYSSSRTGLEGFVVGLVKGLASHFSMQVRISMTNNCIDAAGQHTTFLVEVMES